MWMKVEIFNNSQKIIVFPDYYSGLPPYLYIIFGNRYVKTKVTYGNINNKNDGQTPQNPITIKLTSALRDNLLIPKLLVYQFQLRENILKIGPVTGFLLGNYDYSFNYLQKYTARMKIYSEIGGLFFTFTPDSMDFENNIINGYFYDNINRSWEISKLPFPYFIYVRNFSGIPLKIIEKLKIITGNNIYNSYRFSKIELYDMLVKNENFRQYLPPTEKVNNFYQIIHFIDRNKTILKPTKSSGGRGIYIVNKKDHYYELYGNYLENPTLIKEDRLYKTLKTLDIFSRNYLMQKYVELATIDNSVFDLRIVMQKNTSSIWGCPGIEIRKAKNKRFLTNLAQGGEPLSLTEGLKKAFTDADTRQEVIDKALALSSVFCSFMDESGENYFEFGIDIAIDVESNIWFLEANVLPAYNGFKGINYNQYLSIIYNPVYFATVKTGFKVFPARKNISSFDPLLPKKYQSKD